MLRRLATGTVAAMGICSVAGAAVTFSLTPVGATADGHPANAQATFTTSAGQVHVLLENLQVDPISRGQAISGLFFTLDGGQSGGSMPTSSGVERSIASNGTFADLGPAPTGWSFAAAGLQNRLDVLNTPTAPEHLIIGPPDANNVYGNANASIVGNGPANPFLGLSAEFTLNIPGVTSDTLLSSATFQFGTTPGDATPGITIVPEASMLTATALGALLLRRRNPRA